MTFCQEVEAMQDMENKDRNDYRVVAYGNFTIANKTMYFIIMPRYGENLQQFIRKNGFPVEKDILQIGLSILEEFETIHNCGFTYNDLKPGNILLDYKSDSLSHVNLVDFGLAKRFLDPDGVHLPKRELPHFDGNIMFASSS
jgi:serine/threonine protein kinase